MEPSPQYDAPPPTGSRMSGPIKLVLLSSLFFGVGWLIYYMWDNWTPGRGGRHYGRSSGWFSPFYGGSSSSYSGSGGGGAHSSSPGSSSSHGGFGSSASSHGGGGHAGGGGS